MIDMGKAQTKNQKNIYSIRAADGTELLLTRYRGKGKGDIVFLTHGLSLATSMFTLNEHKNIVNTLLEQGFSEVWLLDTRGSNRFNYNDVSETNTLDHMGLLDIPAAFQKIKSITGQSPENIHGMAFCVGSTALFISLLSGAIPNLKSVIAVQAGPVLQTAAWSKVKLNVAVPLLKKSGVRSLSHVMGESDFLPRKLLAKAIQKAHGAEETIPALISFLSGSGYPAVYQPKNLNEKTKKNIADLFGSMPFSYHDQIRNIVKHKFLVSSGTKSLKDLYKQDDYLSEVKNLKTPILFVTGEEARVFPDSNLTAYQIFEAERPGLQKFLKLSGYGHLDVFIGARAHLDVFPHMTKFLKAHSSAAV